MSQDTPTTAMESASQISDGMGYQSSRMTMDNHRHPASTSSMMDANDDASTTQRSLDHLPMQSIPPQLLLSPGATSNHSVAGNPPRVLAGEEDHTAELALEEEYIEEHSQLNSQRNPLDAHQLDLGERIELRSAETEAITDRLRRSGFSPLDNPVLPLLGSSVEVHPGMNGFQNVDHRGQSNYGSIEDGYEHLMTASNSGHFHDSGKSDRVGLLSGEIPYEVGADVCLRPNPDLRKSFIRSSSSSRRYASLIAWDVKKMRMSITSEAADAVFQDIGTLDGDEDVHNDSEIYSKSNTFKRGTFSLI